MAILTSRNCTLISLYKLIFRSDDDTDKRKKIKLKQEIKRVSPEICPKRKKKKKPPNTTDDVCDIVKREVIDDDAVTIHSDDSEIVAKKSKRKEKNNSTANLTDDSNKTNDESVLENVKIEGKRKRRKRQSWYTAIYFGFYHIFFNCFLVILIQNKMATVP